MKKVRFHAWMAFNEKFYYAAYEWYPRDWMCIRLSPPISGPPKKNAKNRNKGQIWKVAKQSSDHR